jgi:hypothetical protein
MNTDPQYKKLTSEQLQDIFDSEDFDPINFINSRFPNESSLGNLDSEIQTLKQELDLMNTDLIQSIHEHALLNTSL